MMTTQLNRKQFAIVVVLLIASAALTYIDRHRHAAEELRRHNEIMGLLQQIAEKRGV